MGLIPQSCECQTKVWTLLLHKDLIQKMFELMFQNNTNHIFVWQVESVYECDSVHALAFMIQLFSVCLWLQGATNWHYVL